MKSTCFTKTKTRKPLSRARQGERLRITDKPFDRLIFVEKDPQRYARLDSLRKENRGRDIRTENADANSYLRNLQENWRSWRGVLFLDPFATEVEWATIEKIAGVQRP